MAEKQQTLILWHQQRVEELFDSYADTFDEQLVVGLRYDIPNLIRKQVPVRQFRRCIDLGCGTGLGGISFRSCCDFLEGSDISSQMLAKAVSRGVYDATKHRDLVTHLKEQPDASVDLILSSDVVMYVYDLTVIFREAKRVLRQDGLFAFSTESLEDDAGRDVIERESARYAHSRRYVLSLAKGGLALHSVENVLGRMDEGKEIRSDIFVFEKDSPQTSQQLAATNL